MNENGKCCPFMAGCFIIGSLQMIKIPSLRSYCSESFESCRYYQRLILCEREEQLKEVCV